MKLPHMKYGDNITKQTQIAFGGYNHTPNAKDGEIYDMKNISSDLYPLITQRNKREDVGNVSGYLFKGKAFWMGNFGGQGEIFISNKPDIEEKLKFGNVIKLDITGEFESNSGRYIVMSISYNSDGYIRIITNETFSVAGAEEERPPDNDAKIPVNNGELGIKLFQKVKSSEGEESTEITYEDAEVTAVDTTKYTLEDERIVSVRTQIASESGYSKDKKVTFYNVEYETTPIYEQEYVDVACSGDNFEFYSRATGGWQQQINQIGSPFQFYKMVLSDDNGDLIEFIIKTVTQYNTFYYRVYPVEYSQEDFVGLAPTKFKIYKPIFDETSNTQTGIDYITEQDEQSSEVFDADNLTLTETTVNWKTVYKVTTTTTNTVSELEKRLLNICSIDAGESIYFVTDNGDFYYDGVFRGTLTTGDKQFAQTGAFLYILPDNVCYNKITGLITEKTSVRLRGWNHGAYFVGDGVDAENNQDLSMFRAGDIVTVIANSATRGKYTFENVHVKDCQSYNGWDAIYFTENIITRDGYTLEELAESGWGWWSITITKGVPDLKYICADANRIWGCDEKAIYCTSFGNPLGWYEYDASQAGNDADIAWTIEPFDSEGDFTGCCIYNDRPMFFKENKIYKVYGSKASNFQLSSEDTPGVSKGSAESICIIDSSLFYLSPEGVMRYSGNYGTCISDEFYESFENAVGGSDGTHYYITMQSGDEWKTFTYNTKKRLWCIEDDKRVKRYFDFERNVFRHNFDGQIQCINPSSAEYPELFENITQENDFDSFIELGDFYVDVLNKKAPSKLNFRFLVEDGSVEILINYDSEETDGQRVWNAVKTIQSDKKKSIIVPMIPKRCDHYRIKIKGSGKWTLYAMSYEYYVGTEL